MYKCDGCGTRMRYQPWSYSLGTVRRILLCNTCYPEVISGNKDLGIESFPSEHYIVHQGALYVTNRTSTAVSDYDTEVGELMDDLEGPKTLWRHCSGNQDVSRYGLVAVINGELYINPKIFMRITLPDESKLTYPEDSGWVSWNTFNNQVHGE